MNTPTKEIFTNTIEIKKSKFMAICTQINNKEELNNFLSKYSNLKATHNCYAYKFNDGTINGGYNDDGEPKGTAGRPIFSVIEKQDLNNICILVIRHYGGIKLGAGPLTRAYIKSTSELIKTIMVETL